MLDREKKEALSLGKREKQSGGVKGFRLKTGAVAREVLPFRRVNNSRKPLGVKLSPTRKFWRGAARRKHCDEGRYLERNRKI